MGNSHNKIAPASEFDIEIVSIPHLKSQKKGTRKKKNSKSLPNMRPEIDNKLFVFKDNTGGNLSKKARHLPLRSIDLNQFDLGINFYTQREPFASKQIKVNFEDIELNKASSLPIKQPSDLHIEQISLEEFQISPNKHTQRVNLRYPEEYFDNLIKFSES